MVFRITPDCLDEWVADFDRFNYDFRLYSLSFAKAVGYAFDVDAGALKFAHERWCAKCALWEKTMVMPDSNGLSHIKILALLLHELASVEWLKALSEFDQDERNGLDFVGTAAERVAIRDDINGGGGTYFAFQFAMMVINFFEQGRVDKIGTFEFRLTPNLEHDIMVYLVSGRADEMALFLILDALYARPKRAQNGDQ